MEVVDVDRREDLLGDLAPRLRLELARLGMDELFGRLSDHQHRQPLASLLLDVPDLLIALAHELLDLLLLVRFGTVVALLAREELDVDDDPVHSGRGLERGVADIAGLLAEDRLEQTLLGSELGLALGSHLSDEDIARLDAGADADDAVFVEVAEHLLADVRDLARDLLHARLGVADLGLELLDVDRRIDVAGNEAFAEYDSILEVVSTPRHEGDEYVPAKGQLAFLRRGRIGYDVTLLHALADLHERLLVDTGVLVGALVLGQFVLVDAAEPGEIVEVLFVLLRSVADQYAVGFDALDLARPARNPEHS